MIHYRTIGQQRPDGKVKYILMDALGQPVAAKELVRRFKTLTATGYCVRIRKGEDVPSLLVLPTRGRISAITPQSVVVSGVSVGRDVFHLIYELDPVQT
jgi:hypothetical protein